jgi:hypothetical protein
MSDIVERLRDYKERFIFQGASQFALGLAAEIERHRALVADLEREVDRMRPRAKLADRDRRERIATACLAGLLAHPSVEEGSDEMSVTAVRFADALIARLDREAQP